MKVYIDVFYEILHKNSVKRRRMFSLLLVLSTFVSAGVLWELRDTGITMVNEPICGMEEHIHTDECYEDVLVCGLEENEDHTHTHECYQRVLTCGMEQHIHTASCYTDEELPQYDPDDYESNVVVLDAPEEEENMESFNVGTIPDIQLGDEMRTALDDEDRINDMTTPALYPDPVDNIARGIKFTLFDYYESDDALEASQNNYDISWNGSSWVHDNIKYVGVNAGRNAGDDILFFAYGTPAFTGTSSDDDDDQSHNIYVRQNPDKNNYSGDYNTNSRYAAQKSGNRPIQGIVNKTLTNGYPTISGSGNSLDYLFNDTEYSYKRVYQNVNYLLKERVYTNQGHNATHLVYNSNENYAYFDQSSNNFKLYNGTYHIINNDHHRAGDTNNLTDETYGSANGYEMGIGFFPFNEYNTNWRDPNFNGNGFNHHFGLKMEAEFKNETRIAEEGEDPIVFKYSGDDDMWVFVDGVLVLDIGGIHEPAEGIIDFTNGFVWVQDNATDNSASKTKSEILEAFPYLDDNPNVPDYVLPDGWNTDGNKWITMKLEDIFAAAGQTWNAAVGAKHTIQMFYLERGGCYSNLAIDMNLPTVKPLSVVKNVDYKGHYSTDYDKQTTGGQTYQFEIQELINGEYVTANFTDVANPFPLKDGERLDVLLSESDLNKTFRVVEKNIDTEVFENVNVNNTDNIYAASAGNVDVISSGNTLEAVNSYNFTNVIREEKSNITVNKSWIEAEGSGDVTHGETIYFKLYQTDTCGGSSTTKQVEIGGNMTFALNSENSWRYTFENLPTKYGRHIYTYTVKEVNEQAGYVVSYMRNGNDLTIKNVEKSNAKIWLEKQWINAADSDKAAVTLTLKRKKAEITNSAPTAELTINLRDPGGNLLSTVNRAGLYVGGSVEFTLTAPGNIEYYEWDDSYMVYGERRFYQLSSGLGFKQLSEKRFEVSDLQSGANTVDVKIKTDNADDELLLVHHSFTRENDGWEAQGGVTLETSGNNAYAKGDALLIKGKTQAYEGAKLKLDPLKFKAGKTYTFCVGVYYDNRYGAENNPEYVTFKMTFVDGLGNYKYITSYQVQNGDNNNHEWAPLTGTFTLPDEINPYGMYILIETAEGEVVPASFRMDEFFALEGYKKVSVEQNTGVITVQNNNDVAYNYTFVSPDISEWHSDLQGSSTLTHVDETYTQDGETRHDYYIEVSNRSGTSAGAQLYVPNLIPGVTYRFDGIVQGNGDGTAQTAQISIDTVNPEPVENGSRYKNIVTGLVLTGVNEDNSPNNYVWGIYNTDYTIPSYAKQYEMYIYFETPFAASGGDTGSFRIKPFTITPVQPTLTETKAGYTLSDPGINGVYTSNNSQYVVSFDEASITAQQLYSDNYTDDTDWSYTVNLGGNEAWKKQLVKSMLDCLKTSPEVAQNYRYVYYVDSETVNGKTVDVDYILLPIENNYVSANDEDTPIKVKNKNISFRLPATGGSGTVGIYVGGAVLITISLLSGYAVYRQKRRRK